MCLSLQVRLLDAGDREDLPRRGCVPDPYVEAGLRSRGGTAAAAASSITIGQARAAICRNLVTIDTSRARPPR